MRHHSEYIAISISLPHFMTRQRPRKVLASIFMALVVEIWCIGMAGQEVHVIPPTHSVFASNDLKPSSETTATLPIRVTVNLILVPLTVTNMNGVAVTGLDRAHFQLFEDKQKQAIDHVSYEDAPISVGIIFDTSGSMANKLLWAKEAVKTFLEAANIDDEFFIITFADRPIVMSEFTASQSAILEQVALSTAKGSTALLDAIYVGLARMRHAHYDRKALFIISDGGDNHSRYTERQVRSAVRESGTLIYAIGIYDRSFPTTEELAGPALLTDLSNDTGGRAFTIDHVKDLSFVAAQIGRELRTQCVLSYRPATPKNDGKWHKIKVKLTLPKNFPSLSVHAKRGYYAPTE